MPAAGSGGPEPARRDCGTALKVLTQYERLARKLGVRLPPSRVEALNHKRDAGTIIVTDLPGTLRREWPGGMFDGKTLNEIRELCGQRRRQEPAGGRAP